MVTTYTSQADNDEIVSVAELKNHCRVDVADDDALIESFRDAAISFVHQITGRVLGAVTAVVYLDRFKPVTLDIGPITEITGIEYIDAVGEIQTLPAGNYYADIAGVHARIRFHDVPDLYDYALNRVIISVNAGHAAADIPKPIIHAIRLLVAHMYENRAAAEIRSVNEIPFGIHSLLSPFRIFS